MRNKFIYLVVVFVMSLANILYADLFSEENDFYKYYKDGEPDYTDGDLEDKLGDSGYYYDLFPDEREDEPDDYDGHSSSAHNNVPMLTEDFINNMHDIDTRKFKFEFPDGTTGFGTRSEYEKIMREKYTYGAMKIGDKYYYKKSDGTFKTGWYQENNKWYYFDLDTCALVINELREINKKVYYFKTNGQMAQNEIVVIAGIYVRADENGCCQVVE